MPLFLLPMLGGLLKCKVCWAVAGVGALVLAGWVYLAHVKSAAFAAGHAAAVAEQKAATDKAIADVTAISNRWAALANKSAADTVNSEARYAALKGELTQALAAHPDHPCLDPSIGDRLLDLDNSQSVASPGSGTGGEAAPDNP